MHGLQPGATCHPHPSIPAGGPPQPQSSPGAAQRQPQQTCQGSVPPGKGEQASRFARPCGQMGQSTALCRGCSPSRCLSSAGCMHVQAHHTLCPACTGADGVLLQDVTCIWPAPVPCQRPGPAQHSSLKVCHKLEGQRRQRPHPGLPDQGQCKLAGKPLLVSRVSSRLPTSAPCVCRQPAATLPRASRRIAALNKQHL